ncbi:MAG TPA: PDZ domain-containing protein [Steroidobacteraceae bacterium]|nr:PDZ domain-containing protein [Steroidobacteraceae bacterium]
MTKGLAGLASMLGLLAVVGCTAEATRAAQGELRERCRQEGKRPFVLASDQPGALLVAVSGVCVGAADIVHTSPAFGADLVRSSHIQGAGVIDVYPHTIAERAGIQVWDVIVEYAGQSIELPADLKSALAKTAPGDRVQIAILRNKHRVSATAQF